MRHAPSNWRSRVLPNAFQELFTVTFKKLRKTCTGLLGACQGPRERRQTTVLQRGVKIILKGVWMTCWSVSGRDIQWMLEIIQNIIQRVSKRPCTCQSRAIVLFCWEAVERHCKRIVRYWEDLPQALWIPLMDGLRGGRSALRGCYKAFSMPYIFVQRSLCKICKRHPHEGFTRF